MIYVASETAAHGAKEKARATDHLFFITLALGVEYHAAIYMGLEFYLEMTHRAI